MKRQRAYELLFFNELNIPVIEYNNTDEDKLTHTSITFSYDMSFESGSPSMQLSIFNPSEQSIRILLSKQYRVSLRLGYKFPQGDPITEVFQGSMMGSDVAVRVSGGDTIFTFGVVMGGFQYQRTGTIQIEGKNSYRAIAERIIEEWNIELLKNYLSPLTVSQAVLSLLPDTKFKKNYSDSGLFRTMLRKILAEVGVDFQTSNGKIVMNIRENGGQSIPGTVIKAEPISYPQPVLVSDLVQAWNSLNGIYGWSFRQLINPQIQLGTIVSVPTQKILTAKAGFSATLDAKIKVMSISAHGEINGTDWTMEVSGITI